ncbi:lipase family protein [Nocardia sp. NPDC056541]|uniref:lipase family protein n=1 Tax=Nocardia sp. NPDC056541 TaxID=3345860 RepID=UPI00366AAF6F
MNGKWKITAALLVSTAALLMGVGPAGAGPDDGFYTAPNPLPTKANGALIRSQQVELFAGLGSALPVRATRILFQSADARGVPVATSGIVLDPTTPWAGPGQRPLISYAIGTHGTGDVCAPSKLLTDGVQVDGAGNPAAELQTDLAQLVATGYAVVVTDYQGLGTEGGTTYVQPLPEAHAVLDAARAAIGLGVVPPSAPIGIWGFSQGGGSAAAAAEQAAGYAPELDVKGTVAAATPADPSVALTGAENGRGLTGVIGYFINGLLTSHPELTSTVTAMLSPAGIDFLHSTANECVSGTVARWAFRDTRDFTVTGQPIMTSLRADPAVRAVIDSFALGTIAPADPVMLLQNINDDAVPAGPARQLSVDWCAKGADVIYHELDYPPLLPEIGLFGHSATILGADVAMAWLADRLAGVPAQASCR